MQNHLNFANVYQRLNDMTKDIAHWLAVLPEEDLPNVDIFDLTNEIYPRINALYETLEKIKDEHYEREASNGQGKLL